MIILLTIINSFAFIFYGLSILLTNHMTQEFKRYRLLKFRILVGALEVLGGLGCLIGFYFSRLLFLFSCFGLTLLMTMGILTRIKAKDPFRDTVQAIFLLFLNIFLIFKKI